MLVVLVSLLSFLGLIFVPPVFVALLARAFSTPRSMPEQDCRPAPTPAIAAFPAG